MNPQLSATCPISIRNRPHGPGCRGIRNYPQPRPGESATALTIRNLNMLSWVGAQVSDDLPVTEEEVPNAR